MVLHGRVQNGVVVVSDCCLKEGQEVIVLALEKGGVPSGLSRSHSMLDIPSHSVGAVLKPLTSDDDLLGEMLEDRR